MSHSLKNTLFGIFGVALVVLGFSASNASAESPAKPTDPNAPIAVENYQGPIRVACLGDSITQGHRITSKSFNSYPAQLGRLLGEPWQVSNFGVGGATLLNSGDKPYQKQGLFANALKLEPHVVVIMLGTNDSKEKNWKEKDRFIADYKDLIAKVRALPTKPRIFICRPVPTAIPSGAGINEVVVREQLPLIDKVAQEEHVGIIDIHGAFEGKENLLVDRIHPGLEGATVIAKTVYKALTGKEHEGPVPSVSRSEWKGYQQLDFLVGDRLCKLVSPKTSAAGNPWIWRNNLFGVWSSVDEALLGKGFHVAYIDVGEMYGGPQAMPIMDQFYQDAVQNHHLSSKVVLEGFSRGGLYVFNWAARNPEKVAALYVDAPVCDFKSWPGGKGKGPGAAGHWKACLKAYGLTEEEALTYRLNPVDNLKPLADAKIPIVAVSGDQDEVVPVDENIGLVEKRYRELGGEIKVILKPGARHNPHSLTDPTPVVDFLLGTR